MAKAVNIAGLTRAAIEYNNLLHVLPAFQLNVIAKKLRLNIVDVQYEDRAINKRRKAGIIRPYSSGVALGNSPEIMKFHESILKPELIFAEIVDNINDYKPRKVLSNQGEWVDNKTKKHPLEAEIIRDIILSFTEDIAFQLFFAERDESVLTPATSFNGFNPFIDTLITSSEISAAEKNMYATGAFADPTGDTDYKAYDQLVEFIASGNPILRQGEVLLYACDSPIDKARAALKNKLRYIEYPTIDQLVEKLRSDAKCPALQLMQDPVLGTGDRLMLIKPGLLDVGINNKTDDQFVQVRDPYPDPNIAQFWIQAAFGTRVRDIHPKVFQVNDQANQNLSELAGDYQ